MDYYFRLTIPFFFSLLLPISAFSAGPEVLELAPDVYAFIGENGGANSGYIITEEGVVVIDTQGPADLALLLKKKIQDTTNRPILYVINTHYHGDHTFGNQHFKEAKEIIAHKNTKKNLIEKKDEHMKNFIRFFGEERARGILLTLPTITFEKSLSLSVGEERIEIEFLGGGHTDGDVVVYLPKKRVIFAGDLLYKGRLPWVGDGDTFAWLETLKRMISYDVETFVPGHGGIGDKGIVEDFKGYLDELHKEVKALKEKGLSLKRVKEEIKLPKYQGYKMYEKWLSLNAEKVYIELEEKEK